MAHPDASLRCMRGRPAPIVGVQNVRPAATAGSARAAVLSRVVRRDSQKMLKLLLVLLVMPVLSLVEVVVEINGAEELAKALPGRSSTHSAAEFCRFHKVGAYY